MAKMKHTVKSWDQADELFRREARQPKHGGAHRVNLGYATWLHQRWPRGRDGEPDYAVRFHATDVVTYHLDGSMTLATDGWLTKTTKERIYEFTPWWIDVHTVNVPRRSGSVRESQFWVVNLEAGLDGRRDMREHDTVTLRDGWWME